MVEELGMVKDVYNLDMYTFFFLCLQGGYYPMEVTVKSDHLQVFKMHTHAAMTFEGLRSM